MDTVSFGRMGDTVSRLGFGAWAIGSRAYGDVQKQDALDALSAYVDAGGTFIDTARRYGNSEQIIGEFMRAHGVRDQLFLCSKTGSTDESEIREETETSLRYLGVETIDLHYLHGPPDDPGEMERVLAVFVDLKAEGKIRGIGASIKGPNVTAEIQALCRQYIETGQVDAIQLIYSILRQSNQAVFEQAKAAGVALVGRTVLENGFLTGKYKPGHRFAEGDHRARWTQADLDRILNAVAEIEQMPCREYFDGLSQLAIRFAYDEPGLTNLIVGARNGRQVQGNASAAGLAALSDDWRAPLIERFAGVRELGNI